MSDEGFKEQYAVHQDAVEAIRAADFAIGRAEDGNAPTADIAQALATLAVAKATLALSMRVGYELRKTQTLI